MYTMAYIQYWTRSLEVVANIVLAGALRTIDLKCILGVEGLRFEHYFLLETDEKLSKTTMNITKILAILHYTSKD